MILSPEEERIELIKDSGLDFGSVLMEDTTPEYDPFATDVILLIGGSMVLSALAVVAAYLYNDYIREWIAILS